MEHIKTRIRTHACTLYPHICALGCAHNAGQDPACAVSVRARMNVGVRVRVRVSVSVRVAYGPHS